MTTDFLSTLASLPAKEWVRQAEAPRVTADVDQELAADAARGDRSALEGLVRAHLRDVVDAAIAHRRSGVPVETLLRWGLDGLIQAAEQYDSSRHTPFATLARRSIRTSVRQALATH